MRKLVYLMIAAMAVGLILWAARLPGILPEELRGPISSYYPVIQSVAALIIGIAFIEALSSAVMAKTRHLGKEAYFIRNIVLFAGYAVLGVALLVILGVSGESVLAGATFSGLVIGLGLQPVLANLFAGLIILGTGFVRPGARVRIGSSSLPVSLITFPAYKAFSVDSAVATMKGTVVEVGLMYTKVLLDTGELAKMPNSMLFSGSVVLEEMEEEKKVQVRYELPILCDPDVALAAIKRSLDDLGDFQVLLEEQSDKNYYIVLVVGAAPPKAKLRAYRSEVLKRVIKAHRELLAAGSCKQL